MFGPQIDRRRQLFAPGGEGLARQGVDQVHRQAAGKVLGGQLGGAAGLGGVMVAAEEFQRLVVERLQAQRQATHSGLAEGGEAAGLGVRGVGLQADLEIVGGGPEPAGGRHDLRGPARVHQRGRAAAEEDRQQPPFTGQRALSF